METGTKNKTAGRFAMSAVALIAILASLMVGFETADAQTDGEPSCSQFESGGGSSGANDTIESADRHGLLYGGFAGDTYSYTMGRHYWGISADDEFGDVDFLQFRAPGSVGDGRETLVEIEALADIAGAVRTDIWVNNQRVSYTGFPVTRDNMHENRTDAFVAPGGATIHVQVTQSGKYSESSCYRLQLTTKTNPYVDITEVQNNWSPTWTLGEGTTGPLVCGEDHACTGSGTWSTRIPMSLSILDDDVLTVEVPSIRTVFGDERPWDEDCGSYMAPDPFSPTGQSQYTVSGLFTVNVRGGVNSRSNSAADLSNVPVSGTALVYPTTGGFPNPWPPQTVDLSFDDDHTATMRCPALDRLSAVTLDIGDEVWTEYGIGGYFVYLTYELSFHKDQQSWQWEDEPACLDELTFIQPGTPGGAYNANPGTIPNPGYVPGSGFCGELPPGFGSDPLPELPSWPAPVGPGLPGPYPPVPPIFGF